MATTTATGKSDAIPEPTTAPQPSDKVDAAANIPMPPPAAAAAAAQPQPQTQPQPEPPPQASQSQQRKHKHSPSPPRPPPPVDGKSYYGYLFNKDKTTTPLLDALLRAIAGYIASNIGDKNAIGLDPKKLAAFYHAVGGDYDSLFLNAPNESISYIWRALGVQHILQQPPDNFYQEPSIPALTPRGFVRWESIQILLEPQEHVPFMQFAVRNWALNHPDTGKPFPTNLPKESFPRTCDPDIDQWHKKCAERLRQEATMQGAPPHPPPPPGRDPRVHGGFSHVHGPQVNVHPSHRRKPEMDYFTRERPTLFTRVPPTHHPGSHHSSPYSSEQRRVHSNSSDEPRRRRSFNDLKHPPEQNVRFSEHIGPRPAPAPRRYSQPRHYSSPSTSSSESESEVVHPRPPSTSRLYSHVAPAPTSSIRRGPVPPPSSVTAVPPLRPHRTPPPDEDPRRRSLVGEVKHKITSFLSGGPSDHHRSSSREHNGGGGASVRPRYTRETPPPPLRRAHGWSDGSYPSEDDSDSGVSPKQRDRHSHSRSHSDRERERERVRTAATAAAAIRRQDQLEREREREHDREREREDRDRRSRRDKAAYLRPTPADRRPNSHADAERRLRDREREYASWEREHARGRGSDYERGPAGARGRRVATSSSAEDRDPQLSRGGSRRYKDSRGPSPVAATGVSGRRYAAAAAVVGASEPPY